MRSGMGHLQGNGDEDLGALAELGVDVDSPADIRDALANSEESDAPRGAARFSRRTREADAVVPDRAPDLFGRTFETDERVRGVRVPHDVAQRFLNGPIDDGRDRSGEASDGLGLDLHANSRT